MAIARERARIVQIVPSSGWVASYQAQDGTTSIGIGCWALMEYLDDRSGEERFAVGLVSHDGGRLVRADQVEGFLRYEYVGERIA